jgi:hypothetical protein
MRFGNGDVLGEGAEGPPALRAPHPLANAGGGDAPREEVPVGRYSGLSGWVRTTLSKERSRV